MAPRKHSFPPVIDKAVRVLVLGSLPGERSLAEGRYYAHPQNQFWRLIAAVIDRPDLPELPYADRLAALLAAHVGLWDVVSSARRAGSADAALRDVEDQDLGALVAGLPDLRAVGFNGATAHRRGCGRIGAAAPRLALLALPSSSPLHTVGLAAKLPAWLMLRDHLAP